MIRRFLYKWGSHVEFSDVDMDTGVTERYSLQEDGTRVNEYRNTVYELGWSSPEEFVRNRRTKAWGYTEIKNV